MFTTGSKLFVGGTVLSIVAAVVVAFTMGGPVGFMGTVGLTSLAVVLAFVSGVNFYIRDGNVPAMDADAQRVAAAAQPPVGRSIWPLAVALGVAGMVAGAVSKPVVFKVSFIVLLAAGVEWLVQGYSERASADPAYNASIRKRLLHPLEFPILATVIVGLVIYSFSRIMLSASKSSGLWIFIMMGTVILVAAFLFAFKRGVRAATAGGIIAVAALGIVGAGVVSAVGGQRDIEEHASLTPGVCKEEVGEAEMEHADEKANEKVAAQSSVFARIELQENGTLIAWIAGYGQGDFRPQAQSTLTIPRSSTVTLVFDQNFEGNGGEHRLTARLGTFGDQPEVIDCTARIESGSSQFLAINIPKTNAASSTPLELYIPTEGMESERISLVVP